jgi:EAL domain-containing protein (putative c-di-GMP-specific phosphodiesterase class I)
MRNLHDEDFPDLVAERLSRSGIRPQSLVIEITESSLMADPDRAPQIIRRLNDPGVRIAVDDLGTGYSSLSYLSQLPVSELKIEQSFVRHVVSEANDATIVRSTIGLAYELGLVVDAESIEDLQTWDLLARFGCDVGQGYFITRPLPVADLSSRLMDHHRARARERRITARL